MLKTLAIDFGTKNIGLALSFGILAEPLGIIPNDLATQPPQTSQTLESILKTCSSNQVKIILVGISEGDMAQQTKQFVHFLQQQTDIPIHFFDETLSSKEVAVKLHQAKSHKNKQKNIDDLAAALILQNWLDSQPRNQEEVGVYQA